MKKEAHETRRKNKIIFALIVAVLGVTLILVVGLTSSAATYDGMTYTISNGEVTITDCDEFKSGELIIPNTIEGYPVTSIGNSAFSDCTGLTSIEIPNSVKSISGWAFSYCSSLTSIELPDSVTSIGYYAFRDCTSLTSIVIPNGVMSIGVHAFYNCRGLTSVKVDENNTAYDSRKNCNAIIKTETNTLIAGCKNTVIPDSVTSIGDDAFYGCAGLTSIKIPDSVTSIAYQAFCCCIGLTNIELPYGITSIVAYTFYGCCSLSSIKIPNSVTSIDYVAFCGCNSLTSVKIPSSVTSIGNTAFSSCTGLTSIEIPNSVTSIAYQAFYDCSNLTDVYYTGTESDWNKINIGGRNECLTGATIHFNSSFKDNNTNLPNTSDENIRINVYGRTIHSGGGGSVLGSIPKSLSDYSVSPNNGKLKNGVYTLKTEDAVKTDYTVEAKDYQKHIIPKRVFAAIKEELLGSDSTLEVNLNLDKKDGKPYISSVYGRVDESGHSYIDLTKKNLNIESGNRYDIILSGCDMGGTATYCIHQEGGDTYESTDGVFSGELYSSFSDEGKIYAYVKGSNGTSPAVELKLKKVLTDEDAQIKELIDSGELSLLGNIQSVVTSGSKFLDKAKIDLSVFKVPIDCCFEDNTLKVSIGLKLWNKEKSTKGSSTTGDKWKKDWEYSNFVTDFKKLWSDPSKDLTKNYTKAMQLKEKYDKSVYGIESRKKDWDFSFLGYAEWEYINGKYYFKEGAATLCASCSFSYSQQGFVWVIPEYTYFQAKIDLTGSGKLLKSGPSDIYPVELDLSVSSTPQLKVGGGVGVKDLASAGFWGKASLPMSFNFTRKHFTMDAKGEFGYEAKFLFIFGTEKTLLEGTVSLIDKYWNNTKSPAKLSAKAPQRSVDSQEIPLHITDRDYAQNTSAWLGEAKPKRLLSAPLQSSSASDGIRFKSLQTGIFEGATPVIAKSGDSLLMVFTEDNAERDTYNRMRLMYSIYDKENKTWSQPLPVNDDGFNDLDPVLVSDGTNTYVVWRKICQQLTQQTVTAAELCENTEIYISRFDPEIGSFKEATRITDNAAYDYAHSAAIRDGKPVIYYATCTDNNMNGTGNTDLYKYEDGANTKILENKNYVYSISVNKDATEMTYIADEDGDISDSGDVAAFRYSEGGLTRETLPCAVTSASYAELNGKEKLLLTDVNNIYEKKDGEWTEIFDKVTNTAYGVRTIAINGKTLMIWTTVNDDGSSDLYYADYETGEWSESVRLTKQSKLISCVNVAELDGRLYGTVTKTAMDEDEDGNLHRGQVDLESFEFNDYTELAVEFLSANEMGFTKGEECDFDVTVENNGTTDIEKIGFTVSDTIGTNRYELKSVDLKPGEVKNVTLTYPVPEDYRETVLTVTAQPSELTDVIPENNTASRNIGQPDLYFENSNVIAYKDGFLVESYLYNASDVSANDVEVRLKLTQEEGEEGESIYSTMALPNEECALVRAEIENSSLTFDENGIAKVYLTATSSDEDALPEDNTKVIFLDQNEYEEFDGHKYEETERLDSTCSAEGYIKYKCSICEDEYSETIEMKDHTPSDWITDTDSTCTATGTKYKECTVCHEPLETGMIELKEHTPSGWITDSDSTCTATGTKHIECTVCHEPLETGTIEMKEHTLSGWITDSDATCTATGTKHKECTVCHETLEAGMIGLKDHTPVTDSAVPATCTKTGLTEGSHCSVCGTVLTKQNSTPMTQHKDSNSDGKCDTCGKDLGTAPTEPTDPSAACNHMCHKTGFIGFLWKIVNIFNKLFKVNKTCSCGAAHY